MDVQFEAKSMMCDRIPDKGGPQLGFGCMRLPLTAEGHVDIAAFRAMVDEYMAAGFHYFDTARVYINGESETALREALVSRYARESFVLTDKLSGSLYNTRDEIRPLLLSQLASCGTEYFDYYLLHALNADVYQKVENCRAFEELRAFREEGHIRHIGISFHDRPSVLEEILREHPEIEIVQIQLNYLDIDNPAVQSGAVYDICRKYEKPVLVMEPVKGGILASLPGQAGKLINGCPANLAIRYAASFPGVFAVLSGMSDMQQVRSNIRAMRPFNPVTGSERECIEQVRQILRSENTIGCTACRYCMPGCPKQIPIPALFAGLNAVRRYNDWSSRFYFNTIACGKAEACIGCGRCEKICPQHLPIREYLREIRAELTSGDIK